MNELTFIFNVITTVPGSWTEWSQFGKCSKECGGGIQTRSRTCTNPPPSYGGKTCEGPATESKACNTESCTGIDKGIIYPHIWPMK